MVEELSNAEKIIKHMKDAGWESLYNSRGIEIQQAMPPIKERTLRYLNEWSLKHMEPGERVLDVGCNEGILCYHAHKKGCKITGMDMAIKMLESARKEFPDIEFVEGYAEKIPFDDDTFDVVNSNQLLEHLPDPELVITEMLRVLKPKGKLLFTVPEAYAFDDNGKSGHIQHWRFYEIMRMMEKFGENFKIHWISKMRHWTPEGEPDVKGLFAVKFINEVNDDGR